MATCDRRDRLARALRALAAQDIEVPWELIVVNDGPGGPSDQLLQQWVDADGAFSKTVLTTSGRLGPGGARNVGLRAASGELVAFTDDDCEPTPGWLRAFANARRRGADVMQGPTAPHPDEAGDINAYSRTLEVSGLGPWFPTCNMAYPRELAMDLGGFDPSLMRGEDTDLAWRAITAGANVEWVPDALVHHAVMPLGPGAKLRLAIAWAPSFALFARHPALRKALHLGLFWKPSHFLLFLALVGAWLSRRSPVAFVLVLPYAYQLKVRMAAENALPGQALFYVANDGLEITAAAYGSVRAGTLVL
jgi:GT2 family glycosyltransferase